MKNRSVLNRRTTLLSLFGLLTAAALLSQTTPAMRARWDRMVERSRQQEEALKTDPYVGFRTSDGTQPGLFPIKQTGVSTAPVVKAANKFLAALTPEQSAKTKFPVDHPEWRSWMNQHFYVRHGVGFDEMDEAQRAAAFNLMRASLSAEGFKLSRDIMKLNQTLGELNNDNFKEYNEWLYWITVMGEPSADKPWGWQIDGHHLIVNYFVLGDQVVMTPLFIGSEPVIAEAGKYKGLAIMQREQDDALALMRTLNESQRDKAVINTSKDGNDNVGEAFKDNVVLDYTGIKVAEFNKSQKQKLTELIAMYVDNMDEGHAKVRKEEIAEHLDDTYFAWVGGTEDDAVFYYRIHSPVVLIEFDHQGPIGIRHLMPGTRKPIRQHIHAVVRTPNGNDYGKDLLRQHYKQSHRAD